MEVLFCEADCSIAASQNRTSNHGLTCTDPCTKAYVLITLNDAFAKVAVQDYCTV